MIRVATIARNPLDSPNMTANDAAILGQIGVLLKKRGAEVVQIKENEDIPQRIGVVCTMSRTASMLQRLKDAEARGTRVINPTIAVERCSRRLFMEILSNSGIPQPKYKVIENSDELLDDCFPCWIKKADGWSNYKEDVTFAHTKDEAIAAIRQMESRGISLFIQMQHCQGDIIKFYGIGKHFFHYCRPTTGKFGHEEFNGTQKNYTFDAEKLRKHAQTAAKAIGLAIYGGDAIITPEGNIFTIDLNDFPSFTAIREEAAEMIVKLIMDKTE